MDFVEEEKKRFLYQVLYLGSEDVPQRSGGQQTRRVTKHNQPSATDCGFLGRTFADFCIIL